MPLSTGTLSSSCLGSVRLGHGVEGLVQNIRESLRKSNVEIGHIASGCKLAGVSYKAYRSIATRKKRKLGSGSAKYSERLVSSTTAPVGVLPSLTLIADRLPSIRFSIPGLVLRAVDS